MIDSLYNILLCIRDFFVWVLLGALVIEFFLDLWKQLKYYIGEEEKEEKPPRKLTNKERKRIEKAIDDAYKRMR